MSLAADIGLKKNLLAPALFVVGLTGLLMGTFLAMYGLEAGPAAIAGAGLVLVGGGAALIEWGWRLDDFRIRADAAPRDDSHAAEALCLQSILLIFFALLTDSGAHAQAGMFAIIAYFGGLLLIWLRRSCLTRTDRLFVRWGWLPFFVIGVPLACRYWRSLGRP